MPDSKYRFDEQESYDHRIVDAESKKKIGTLRVKPSSILWKPVNERKFLKVSLDKFAAWIARKGKSVKQ